MKNDIINYLKLCTFFSFLFYIPNIFVQAEKEKKDVRKLSFSIRRLEGGKGWSILQKRALGFLDLGTVFKLGDEEYELKILLK